MGIYKTGVPVESTNVTGRREEPTNRCLLMPTAPKTHMTMNI